MHALGVRANSFDVALAMFSFNSTDPAKTLDETGRILAPGGRLVLQEWGTTDALTEVIEDTLAEYAPDDPPPELSALRAVCTMPVPWDALEESDDIVQALQRAGFDPVEVDVVTETVALAIEVFISYKLAWANRRAEVEAMPVEIRGLFLSELRDQLETHLTPEGCLLWQPNLVRVRAYKP
jgi:SAM-dependent methyltransferase